MIHATCISYLSTAQEDLQIVANELFNSTRQTDGNLTNYYKIITIN